MKLTGPQEIVMASAENGLVWRGKHNETCRSLAKLGLLKFEEQPSPYGPSCPNQPAWRVLKENS